MRIFISVLVLAAAVILGPVTLCMATDEKGEPASRAMTEAFYQQMCRDDPFNNLVTLPLEVLLAGDSDRGCCVWKTTQPKCVYTNRAFCMSKAKQAKVAFEFHKGAECKAIPACK